jgi:hypothetical protein
MVSDSLQQAILATRKRSVNLVFGGRIGDPADLARLPHARGELVVAEASRRFPVVNDGDQSPPWPVV